MSTINNASKSQRDPAGQILAAPLHQNGFSPLPTTPIMPSVQNAVGASSSPPLLSPTDWWSDIIEDIADSAQDEGQEAL